MIRTARKILAVTRRSMCVYPVCLGGRGPRRRHQRSLAARHGQHPRQSAGPVPTSVSSQYVRGAVDTARRSRQDRIVLRCDRGLGCGCRGHVPVRAGDLRRVRQADSRRAVPSRPPRSTRPTPPMPRRATCARSGSRTTRPWPWWPTTAAIPDRRARPPRPATPNRYWPLQPATRRRARECPAVSKRPPSPTPSRRSAPPTSTAATPPRPGSTAPDWSSGPMGWPGWSCPGWPTTSGTTSLTLP